MVNLDRNQNGVTVRMKEKGLNFIINGMIINLVNLKMNNGKKKNGIGFIFLFQKTLII